MAKIQFTQFTCDQCGKIIKSSTGFPYEQGWIYLYNLQIKLKDNRLPNDDFNTKTYADGHFCSKKCFCNFVIDHIYRGVVNA